MELDLNHDLHSLLPPFYREIAEYQQVCDAEKAQFSRTADSVRVIGQNFFVQTMDADSVQKWEQVLHIRAKPLTETLSFRRQRILSRLCTRPPFTLAFLYQQLDTLLGVGRWTCRVDYPAYLLTIGTHVEDKLHREELIHMVNQIKPAHIVFGMYLFCDPVEAYAYAAAAPCIRLPSSGGRPGRQKIRSCSSCRMTAVSRSRRLPPIRSLSSFSLW